MSELVKSTSIEALLLRRDGMLQRVEKACALLAEADLLSEGLCTVSYAITGTQYHREMQLTDDHAVEQLTKRIDAAGWSHLMSESGLRSFMDMKARAEWDEKTKRCEVPPLTPENIQSTFTDLYAARGDMFERGVLNVFRRLSWHYKTNLPQKFGKRIVLNYVGAPGFSMGFERRAELDDLARVFHVLDGKPEPDHRDGFGEQMARALLARQSSFGCAYWSARMFKKGSAHLTFRRLDLVDRMNQIIGKHYPGALPAPKA